MQGTHSTICECDECMAMRRTYWPLPNEWDTYIPPQPIKIIEQSIPMDSTRPVWNDVWLRGLESYVRSIVRDEIALANANKKEGM